MSKKTVKKKKKKDRKSRKKNKREKKGEENSVYTALFFPDWHLMAAQAPGYILICRAR